MNCFRHFSPLLPPRTPSRPLEGYLRREARNQPQLFPNPETIQTCSDQFVQLRHPAVGQESGMTHCCSFSHQIQCTAAASLAKFDSRRPCRLANRSCRDRLELRAVRTMPPGVCCASPVEIGSGCCFSRLIVASSRSVRTADLRQ